ncbi:MAG TPA: DUF3302 domain-containing protein [Dongiaceae bacterium]|nr:DUF3302 domain-containing protein [Dongiaceae bacterium]
MLEYVALGILIFAAVVLFYGVIVIHDIPYDIAKHRNHPHQDAIHVAGWVSLLTLHVIWPFLWIWATLYREDRGWGFGGADGATSEDKLLTEIAKLHARVEALEQVKTVAAETPAPSAPQQGGAQ